jgi:very-short-patch-repair endonuclease
MLRDEAPKTVTGGTTRARRLRRAMSLPEVLLWPLLRARPFGLKYRRQHPSGVYILDFYCGDARLAIEVDGRSHETGDRPRQDAVRDGWLAAHGIATIRIAATDVLSDPVCAADVIIAASRARLPLHHPAAPHGPPPRD